MISKIRLRLMAEFDCFPLWKQTTDGVENIAPASLAVSPELQRDINAWANAWQATFNRSDPLASGFTSALDEVRFDEAGRELWARLQKELRSDFEVSYFSPLGSQEETSKW